MPYRQNYNDLYAFLLVAQEKNFARASDKLGVSPQALSKTIKLLESRLGLQLFNRTTRTVSLTHAGEKLFATAQKSFAQLDSELTHLAHYRNAPSGTVKISAGLQVVQNTLIPKLAHFQTQYPDITVHLSANNRFVDIVTEGFDAGVRLGDDVGEMMIAVKISEPLAMTIVASPSYIKQFGLIKTPDELVHHQGIGYVMSNGKLYEWELIFNGKPFTQTPPCRWLFDDDEAVKTACLHGLGLAYLPQEIIADELASGKLVVVLPAYCPSLPALYLYYPHRNISPALKVVVESLRV
ncbi:LysR family transcriptional regulator [Mannheimia indoligenes]|uniref:LysR family transcriptional regulator n=1 Tax=Mannheimia indoligenes TaxID=3103145 RepID=A0ABU7ZFF6_9PAST